MSSLHASRSFPAPSGRAGRRWARRLVRGFDAIARQWHVALRPACWGVLLLAVAPVAFAADAPVAREYQIKAAFLFNFTRFVEWPAHRFITADSPIVMGVFGRDPFGGELEKIVAGRRVNGRSILVRAVGSTSDLSTVHLLFVPAGEDRPAKLAALLAGQLAFATVGESERFTALGGMITFVPEADKVRFTINLVATERAGLKLSAQLLKLASAVRRSP